MSEVGLGLGCRQNSRPGTDCVVKSEVSVDPGALGSLSAFTPVWSLICLSPPPPITGATRKPTLVP